MTIMPDERLTLEQLRKAAQRVEAMPGCSDQNHAAVVTLITLTASVLDLVYEKLNSIFDELSLLNDKLATDAITPVTWTAVLKKVAMHSPLSVALVLAAFMAWCALVGLTPLDVLPFLRHL